ncbi:hypothetical protein ARMGADRAFT_95269 [Armillaria gallica]|uniref:Uncharacterized protein n=1 Tax=Armillaria gallica TaxID=47427 RepID=A0A2H3CDN9_ARMGA|nr:hypothetical protein ARMGADRAFT_95269 [Armillaria gallica]
MRMPRRRTAVLWVDGITTSTSLWDIGVGRCFCVLVRRTRMVGSIASGGQFFALRLLASFCFANGITERAGMPQRIRRISSYCGRRFSRIYPCFCSGSAMYLVEAVYSMSVKLNFFSVRQPQSAACYVLGTVSNLPR